MRNDCQSRDSSYEGVSGLLSRLEMVRQRGASQWSARCPAHNDKSPSLSVKELPDGRVLLHCFGGCSAADVLSAIGLGFDALFPESTKFQPPERRRRLLSSNQALELLDNESLIVLIVARDIYRKRDVNAADLERVSKAYGRIAALRDEVAK